MEGLIFASFQADGKSKGLTEVINTGDLLWHCTMSYNELLSHMEVDLSTIPRR